MMKRIEDGNMIGTEWSENDPVHQTISITELVTKIIISQFYGKEIYHRQQYRDLVLQRLVCKQFSISIDNHVIPKIKYLSEDLVQFLTKEVLVKFTNLRTYHASTDNIHIVNCFTNLMELNLGDCFGVQDYEWYNLIHKLVKLEKLFPPTHDMNEMDINRLTNITHLGLRNCKTFTGGVFSYLPRLTSLDLDNNKAVVGESLIVLTNLRILDLTNNRMIRDDTLSQLTSLVELVLCDNQFITDRSISNLTNLTKLTMIRGTLISNRALECLPNLECLWIDGVETKVAMEKIGKLTSLKTLKTECINIYNHAISDLTNLTHLDIRESNVFILSKTFSTLTKLTTLIYESNMFDGDGLKNLHNLTHLDIWHCPGVTDDGIRHMTGLIKLYANKNITMDSYTNFPNLRLLNSRTDVISPIHNALTNITGLTSPYESEPSIKDFEKFKSLKFLRLVLPCALLSETKEFQSQLGKRYVSLGHSSHSRFLSY